MSTSVTTTEQRLTASQRFATREAALLAQSLSDNFSRKVSDEEIAREVKRTVRRFNQKELMIVIWGTSQSTVYRAYNWTDKWGIGGKYDSPKRYVRNLVHGLLCTDVLEILEGEDCYADSFPGRSS